MLAAKCHSQSQKSNPTSQKWLAEAKRTGEKDNYAGKRRQPRCTWDVQVTVEILENGEPTETLYANTRDISAGGMGMRCRKVVPAHSEVRITIDETGESMPARVTQCTRSICDYQSGVEVVRKSQTSATPAVSGASSVARLRRTACYGRFARLHQTHAA